MGSQDGLLLRLIGPSEKLLAALSQRHTIRLVSDFIDESRFSGRGGYIAFGLFSATGVSTMPDEPCCPCMSLFKSRIRFFIIKIVRLDTPVTPATFSPKHTFRNRSNQPIDPIFQGSNDTADETSTLLRSFCCRCVSLQFEAVVDPAPPLPFTGRCKALSCC
jgi:hypothetical protein